MSVTLTQADAGRPPVIVAVTGLPSVTYGTVTGVVQRSTDGGIRYATVRGMAEAVITAGALADVDDWEYRADVVNTYRAGVNQEAVATFGSTASNAWPNADTGQAWSGSGAAFNAAAGVGTIAATVVDTLYSTALDVEISDGEISWMSGYSTGAITGTGGVSAGVYFRVVDIDNCYIAYLTVDENEAAQLVLTSYIGSVEIPLTSEALPAFTGGDRRFRVKLDGARIRVRTWLASDPQPQTWNIDYTTSLDERILSGGINAYTYRSPGNTNAAWVTEWDDFVMDTGTPTFLQTQTITPTLTGFWLTSVMRSFLNIAPRVIDYSEPARQGRGGASFVAGRSLPGARAELMQSREIVLTIRCASLQAARTFEYLIASGDIVYLQAPADCPIPYGHYQIDRMGSDRVHPTSAVRYFDLSLREVAAPGPDIVTAQSTWDTVIASYGSWAAVVAANASWDDVLSLIGEPSEVIVE